MRQLALFEPPIDPAALVKAVAGGVDIERCAGRSERPAAAVPLRYAAAEGQRGLRRREVAGGALLPALEKKDAEALGLLRQRQEIRMLEAVKALREKQIDEAKENLEGLKRSKTVVKTQRDYYRDLGRLNAQEQLHLDKMAEAHLEAEIAQGISWARRSSRSCRHSTSAPPASAVPRSPRSRSAASSWARPPPRQRRALLPLRDREQRCRDGLHPSGFDRRRTTGTSRRAWPKGAGPDRQADRRS